MPALLDQPEARPGNRQFDYQFTGVVSKERPRSDSTDAVKDRTSGLCLLKDVVAGYRQNVGRVAGLHDRKQQEAGFKDIDADAAEFQFLLQQLTDTTSNERAEYSGNLQHNDVNVDIRSANRVTMERVLGAKGASKPLDVSAIRDLAARSAELRRLVDHADQDPRAAILKLDRMEERLDAELIRQRIRSATDMAMTAWKEFNAAVQKSRGWKSWIPFTGRVQEDDRDAVMNHILDILEKPMDGRDGTPPMKTQNTRLEGIGLAVRSNPVAFLKKVLTGAQA